MFKMDRVESIVLYCIGTIIFLHIDPSGIDTYDFGIQQLQEPLHYHVYLALLPNTNACRNSNSFPLREEIQKMDAIDPFVGVYWVLREL